MMQWGPSVHFWAGVGLVALGLAAPWIGVPGSFFALAGLLAHEHAYVQAGQSFHWLKEHIVSLPKRQDRVAAARNALKTRGNVFILGRVIRTGRVSAQRTLG